MGCETNVDIFHGLSILDAKVAKQQIKRRGDALNALGPTTVRPEQRQAKTNGTITQDRRNENYMTYMIYMTYNLGLSLACVLVIRYLAHLTKCHVSSY